MVRRNGAFERLAPNYLFLEIGERRKRFLATAEGRARPLVSLGVGDTTEPLPAVVCDGFREEAERLSRRETYTGYPAFNGSAETRELIAKIFYPDSAVTADDICLSDGSKPDLGRLQTLFSADTTVAVQSPTYPVYLDATILSGKCGIDVKNVVSLECTPENGFFPSAILDGSAPRTDLIYFCSPNNPTGVAATRDQLQALIDFARKNKSIVIFDSAYAGFISAPDVPRNIYQLNGALECVFETSSFSKLIGFTGVRCGWTVCPAALKFDDGRAVRDDWHRVMATCFNGTSNLAEAGARAALSDAGRREMRRMLDNYMQNARLVRDCFAQIGQGFRTFGGVDSPYVWVQLPPSLRSSWDAFDFFLTKCHVVVTPGLGFGACGEGFIRISAFAHSEDVEEALKRIRDAFNK